MKLLIIDDEEHVIEGITYLLDWKKFNFSEVIKCTNSEIALIKIREEKPEIIITDMMMPNIHGMELILFCKDNSPLSKVIVVSGHTDFNYVQHTIRHGGVDYITKPIKREALNDAIEKAFEIYEADTQYEKLNEQYSDMNEIIDDSVFLDFCQTGKIPEESFVEKYSIKEPVKLVAMELIDVSTKDIMTLLDKNTLLPKIKTVVSDYFDSKNNYILRNLIENKFIFLFWNKGNEAFNYQTFCSTIYEKLNIKVFCSVTKIDKLGVKNNYLRTGIDSLRYIDMWSDVSAVNFENITMMKYHNIFSFKRDEIIFELKCFNKCSVFSLIDEEIDKLYDIRSLNGEQVTILINDLDRLINYTKKHLELETQEKRYKFKYFNTKEEFISDLKLEYHRKFDMMLKNIRDTYEQRDKIEVKIKNYIDKHYQEKISLMLLEEEFFVSKEHISRIFKKKYNVTILNYIKKLRLNKAKELLDDEQLLIKDVALLIGFDDEKYFSKQFRQEFGVTPNNYRKK